jgi:vesicle transport protein SEC22
MIEDGVCFLVLSDRSYPRKLVYAYLDEVHRAFISELQSEYKEGWQNAVATAARAYYFLRFGKTT